MTSQFQYKNLSYDPRHDLKLVSLLAHLPGVLCVPSDIGVTNLHEFIQYAKANKGKLSFGSFGDGTHPHMIAEYINKQLDIDLLHIPYRGEAASLQALIAKEVQIGMFSTMNAASQITSGNIKAIAAALSNAINQVVQETNTKSRLATDLGVLVQGTSPTRFEEIYDQEINTWKMLFENSGAQAIG